MVSARGIHGPLGICSSVWTLSLSSPSADTAQYDCINVDWADNPPPIQPKYYVWHEIYFDI